MNSEVSHKIDLTEYVMRSFSAARILRCHEDVVHGLDYSYTGTNLVSSSRACISVIDCGLNGSGIETARISVRKYGAGAVKFFQDTNSAGSIAVASTNDPKHTIRSLELSKCSYSRAFKGHERAVCSISTSPVNSSFISGDVAGSMKLWDVREKSSVAYLHTHNHNPNTNGNLYPNGAGNGNANNANANSITNPNACCVSFDPKGVIFGVLSGNVVKLYDCKKFSQGPFVEFPVLAAPDTNGTTDININGNGNGNGNSNGNIRAMQATTLKFSSDGEYFLVLFPDAYSPENSCVKVFDAYKGNISRTFHVPSADGQTHNQGYNTHVGIVEATFSSDAKFVLAGSSDGSIYCWDLLNDKLVSRTERFHSGNISHIAFNPSLAQYATACQNVAVWVPHPNSSLNSNAY